MDTSDERLTRQEEHRIQASIDELVQRIGAAIRQDGTIEPLPGLHFNRRSAPTELAHSVGVPAVAVIAQGSKQVALGSETFQYDPARYLIATVGLPVASRIVMASLEHPYLSVRLDLDPGLVGSVMVEAGNPGATRQAPVKAIDVSPLDADLLDAVVRLVRLVDSPAEARFLAPLVTREIVYRLLVGAQGARLRQVVSLGGDTHRIATAVSRLRQAFDRPLRIEETARELGMSVSSFHHHFKAVTAMSPLQFQKHLRLQEARRLMLSERLDATSAGLRVGYDDTSQFSREYKRLFGDPPLRDVSRLRSAALEPVGL
jgi:AraC-like DNA-binding protein